VKIGFIGTGIMGLPMAANLLKAGNKVRVFNRTEAKAEPLIEAGAEIASSPADAAKGAEVIISIVSQTEDVREVLFGASDATKTGAAIKSGAVHGASPGSLFIDMSTIDSEETRKIAIELQKLGIDFMDAPVSGGETGAINASLTIFCGGSETNVERAAPILNSLGKSINHMGPVGTGQIAKACNQILAGSALMGVAEALAYGDEHGLDLQQLIKATSGGAAQSWQLENLGPLMAKKDYSPGFMIDLFHKDLSMVLQEAKNKRQKIPITELFIGKLEELQKSGDGRLGSQAIYKQFCSNKNDS